MSQTVLLVRSSAFQTSRLAKTAFALREAGYEVSILSWRRKENRDAPPLRSQLDEAGFPIYEIWIGEAPYAQGVRGIPKRLRYVWSVMKYVRDHDFDVVHAIDIDSAFPVAAARWLGWHTAEFVFDIADYIELYYTIPASVGRAVAVVNQWVLKNADLIVLPDENRKQGVPKTDWSRTTIVTNAPDLDEGGIKELRDANSKTSKLDLFYYGSFAEDRGVDVLLDAARQLPDANIWFAGWGNLSDRIEEAANQTENVYFLGSLSHTEVMQQVAEMDLIVIMYDPAYGVNQMASPNKLFEAMALGKPVVVARNTSIDELVEYRKMGWTIDYDAKALTHLVQSIDDEDIAIRGKHAEETYQEYAWPKSERRLTQAYAQL